MIKISVVDGNKLAKYVNSVSIDKFSVTMLLKTLNSGKKKYDIESIIEYLVSLVYNKLNNRSPISNNQLGKYLYAINKIFEAYNGAKVYLGEDIISKASLLEEIYINNRNMTGKDGDEILIDYFEETKKLIDDNENFKNLKEEPKEERKEDKEVKEAEVKEESKTECDALVASLQAKVNLLEEELMDYKRAINTSSKQNATDEKEINKLNQKINKLKNDLTNARKEVKKIDKEKQELEKKANKKDDRISALNKTIDEYALKIEEMNSIIENISKEKETLQNINNGKDIEIISLKEEIRLNEEKLLSVNNQTSQSELLDDYILNLLFTKKMSLNNIYNVLLKSEFDVSKDDILASLKRINNTINVQPAIAFEKKFGIVEPAYRTNAIINFPNHSKSLDVVFLADYHYDAGETSGYLQEKLNSVYDYCVTHKIKNIITLGDIIDNKNIPTGISKENYEIVKDFLKDFDRILPYDVGIKHFMLGGNHDKGFLKFGIDPIEDLAFEREDTISLGYSNAYIFFGGSDVLGLHHEGIPRESFVPDLIESGNEAKDFLETAYQNARVNIAERYLDLFGHFHKGRIDILNSYGIVPSLNADRNTDGAWHLKFDLDSSGRINYIIIYSLVFGRSKEIQVANETVYKKIKNKPLN